MMSKKKELQILTTENFLRQSRTKHIHNNSLPDLKASQFKFRPFEDTPKNRNLKQELQQKLIECKVYTETTDQMQKTSMQNINSRVWNERMVDQYMASKVRVRRCDVPVATRRLSVLLSKFEEKPTRVERERNDQLKVRFYQSLMEVEDIKPGFREGATLTWYGGGLYLYGGFGEGIRSDMVWFSLKERKWREIGIAGEYGRLGRCGHSCNVFGDGMIIFGGEKCYNRKMKMRECLNDVLLFNFETHELSKILVQGEYVTPRRFHSSGIINNYLLVYGGIGSNEHNLSDILMLNLSNYVWKNYKVRNVEGLSYHCMVGVFGTRRRDEIQEGFYIFGGNNTEFETNNKLKLIGLNHNNRPQQFQVMECKGVEPCARYSHSMHYYSRIQQLIVIGGRTDVLEHVQQQQQSQRQVILDDVWGLQLSNMVWQRIQVYGMSLWRCSHSSEISGDRIFVFGGIGASGGMYHGPEVYVLDMDSKQVMLNVTKDNAKSSMLMNNNKKQPVFELSSDFYKRMSTKYIQPIVTYQPIP